MRSFDGDCPCSTSAYPWRTVLAMIILRGCGHLHVPSDLAMDWDLILRFADQKAFIRLTLSHRYLRRLLGPLAWKLGVSRPNFVCFIFS